MQEGRDNGSAEEAAAARSAWLATELREGSAVLLVLHFFAVVASTWLSYQFTQVPCGAPEAVGLWSRQGADLGLLVVGLQIIPMFVVMLAIRWAHAKRTMGTAAAALAAAVVGALLAACTLVFIVLVGLSC